MIVVSQNRKKCIGCNYCVELALEFWRMSKRDGKSVLLGASEKKGMFTARFENKDFDANEAAAKACPVNIIKVKQL